MSALPIDAALPALLAALRERGLAVLSWGTSHQAPANDCTPQWTGPIYTEESA